MPSVNIIWLAVSLAGIVVVAIWYLTVTVAHRSVERISLDDPKTYNFSFLRASRKRRK